MHCTWITEKVNTYATNVVLPILAAPDKTKSLQNHHTYFSLLKILPFEQLDHFMTYYTNNGNVSTYLKALLTSNLFKVKF